MKNTAFKTKKYISEHDFINFNSFEKVIDKLTESKSYGECWFRGCSDNSHGLIPGIYRSRSNNVKKNILEKEEQLINDFYIQAPSVLSITPQTGFEWLSLMQHYRAPTRLLDWSENALQALFFSILGWDTASKAIPCVYMLIPNNLNKPIKKNSGAFIMDNPRLNNWLPNTLRFYKNTFDKMEKGAAIKPIKRKGNKPVAVYLQHYIHRISSQSGCFTLHGSYKGCLTEYVVTNKLSDTLYQINLASAKDSQKSKDLIKETILKSLQQFGVNEFRTYQDLDSLSSFLKRIYLEK